MMMVSVIVVETWERDSNDKEKDEEIMMITLGVRKMIMIKR